MQTITSKPFVDLIGRLFTASEAAFTSEMAKHSRQEIDRLLSSAKTDYRGFYQQLAHLPLAVSRETGMLLYMLGRACGARAVVEFGTSIGVSTLYLAAAVKDNGGGTVIGTEFEPSKLAAARAHLDEAGLSSLVDLRAGDALETLSRDLPERVDLVLLDGAKVLYPKILALLEPRLRSGAFVIADNASDAPQYVARVRDHEHGYVSLPFGDDVEVSMRG